MPENLQNSCTKWIELIGILRGEMTVSQAAVQWLTDLEILGMMV